MTDSLGFLIGDLARLMRRRFDERAREIGVTRPQWRALLNLSRQEGLKQTELAERMEVEPITLCRMVDRLEASGLVERRPDPADRRARRLFLTEDARPIIARLRAVADDLADELARHLSPGEQTQLTALTRKLHESLSAAAEARRSEEKGDVVNG